MKLLLDQNIAARLVIELESFFPGSVHVRSIEMDRSSDEEIWEFAKTEGYAIVSKDTDFYQRSVVLGHPPKVVWLNVGNCSTARIVDLLRDSKGRLERFFSDQQLSFVVLN